VAHARQVVRDARNVRHGRGKAMHGLHDAGARDRCMSHAGPVIATHRDAKVMHGSGSVMHDIAAAMRGFDHCGSRETGRRRAATRAAPTGGVSPSVLVVERAACALYTEVGQSPGDTIRGS
jgi:hypothetical protein